MKYLILILVTSVWNYAKAQTAKLILNVENVKPAEKSVIYIGIYDNKDSFAIQGKEVFGKQVKVKDQSSLTVSFEDLPAGTYAIAVFHDSNNNGKLDKNWLGVPTEGYGFSNATGTLGPPDFQDAIVNLKKGYITELNIKLKY